MSSSPPSPAEVRSRRGWLLYSLIGIPVWIGLTVVAAIISGDASDPAPILLTFAVGGALFFAGMFGAALWQLRGPSASGSATFWRRVARGYLVLGVVVTALALAAVVQAALGIGAPELTMWIAVGIVFLWSLAVPYLARRAGRERGDLP